MTLTQNGFSIFIIMSMSKNGKHKEERKWAFKKSITCGVPTILLTAVIMYFSMSKEFAAAPLTLAQFGVKIGVTVTVTSLICCFLQYLIVGGEFKKQFTEGHEKLP